MRSDNRLLGRLVSTAMSDGGHVMTTWLSGCARCFCEQTPHSQDRVRGLGLMPYGSDDRLVLRLDGVFES